MKYLAIKNFEQFQHYKDRAPLWIKMHTSVLSDFALLTLPEAAQAQLFKLWILASRLENRIPNDKKFICAQIFAKKLYLAELVAAGFLLETDDDATPLRADWASRYVSAEVRAAVLAKTDGRCAACGSMEDVEIDHVVPISKGGTGEESNLQALCRKCNRKKRTRSVTAEQLATQTAESAEPREEEEKNRGEDKNPNSSLHSDADSTARREAQYNCDTAIAELAALLTEVPGADDALAGFMEGLPSAVKRLTWARSLMVSLQPINGGRKILPTALVSAMADFNLAERSRFPYTGSVFRAFADKAMRDLESPPEARSTAQRSAGNRMTDPTLDALDEWQRTTDAKEKIANG